MDMISLHDNFKVKAKWKSKNKKIDCFGILEYKDEYLILDIFGTFEDINEMSIFQENFDNSYLEIVEGKGEKIINLYDLKRFGGTMRKGWITINYICGDMFIDSYFDKYQQKVSKITFSFSNKWAYQISVNVLENRGMKKFLYMNSCILIQINENTKLSIIESILPSVNVDEFGIKRTERFEITSSVDISLEEMIDYQRSINHFLQFCTNIPIFPLSIKISDGQKYTEYFPDWLLIQKKSVFEREVPRKYAIVYADIENNLEPILKKWFPFWSKNKDIMFTFFGISNNKGTLENEFGTFVDVLQRFYESEFGKKSLSNKLEYYISLCPDSIKQKIISDDFKKKIQNTRIYNTHGIPNEPEFVAKGGPAYYFLIRKLQTLIDFFIIEQTIIDPTLKEDLKKKCYDRNMEYRHL